MLLASLLLSKNAIKESSNRASCSKSKVADAYYYRGLAKIILHQKDNGCLDLSKAGELGFYQAYDEIKKYCK